MIRLALAFSTLVSAAWLVPVCAAGQPVQAQPSGEASDSLLDYEREVFVYSSRGRRNPFRPLTTFNASGPRFEDLEVAGIVFSPAVGSVVVVADRTTERRYRLREGERVGNARVMEIRPDEVVFGITTFGVSRQAILRVKKLRGPGE